MPEAVIVSTARSPIGRAMKGSLVSMRPDDLAAQMVRAALDKVEALNPHQIDDLILGCGLPGRRAGLQHGPRGRRRARLRLPAGHHRQPLLFVVAADHPDGVPRDQGRRGRRVHLRRRRDGVPIRQGQLGLVAGHQEPAVRRGRPADGHRRRGRHRLARPPQRPRHPRRLHRDGSDRRERRDHDRHQPRGPGPLGRAQPEPRRGSHQERLLRARDRPGHAARRHHGQHRRRATRRERPTRRSASSSRSSGPTAR